MNKKTKVSLVLGAIVVLALILSIWGFSKLQGSKGESVLGEDNSAGITIFYGQGCPHCKDLEDFIAKNNLEEKVKTENLEVWFNKENAKLLAAKAQECGIPKEKVGVPFLYSEGKCLSGTPDIENFLMEKAGLK